jgi:thiamine biosynthesis lipoprotein
MGSPCALRLYCQSEQQFDHVNQLCINEMARLESKYSRYLTDSIVSKINTSAGSNQTIALDDESWMLMQYADTAYQQSNGLFDVTSGVFRTLWDFKKAVIPEQIEIEKLENKIGWHKLTLNQQAFSLPEKGMQIDFGGIVKEYAADALVTLLEFEGIQHGLIDLAGDMRAIGSHPNNYPWKIGIKHPVEQNTAIATIPMTKGGLATSGDYARCFELNGIRYSHIINPKTGWPVQGLASVSVWAPQCIVAGTIATIVMLLGHKEGEKWLNELGLPYLIIDQEMNVHSSGI